MKLSREFVRDGETVGVQVERIEGDRFRVRVGDNTYEYDQKGIPFLGALGRAVLAFERNEKGDAY